MKINLTLAEASELLSPLVSSKLGYEASNVTVAIEVPQQPFSGFVPVPLQDRLPELKRLIRLYQAGYYQKIAIIKEIRTVTGWGLKDAKDFVELFMN